MKRKGNSYIKLYKKLHREKIKAKRLRQKFTELIYVTPDIYDSISKIVNSFFQIGHSLCAVNDGLDALIYSMQWLKKKYKDKIDEVVK